MRTSFDDMLKGLLDRWERRNPQSSELKKREKAEDSIVNYFVMFFSVGMLGLIVLIKLFTGF